MPSKLEARVAEHDKKIAAIQKLILTGMRMISNNAAQIRVLTKAQQETNRAQRETDRMLKDLIRS